MDDAEIERLVREEQSLRDLAMLVATAGPAVDILTAICRAASDQLNGQEITLLRFETDDTIVAVATHGGPVPTGVRVVHPPGSLSERIARSRRPVRVDDFDRLPSAGIVRRYGIRAGVGVPIFIEGEVWGAFVASSQIGALPENTEARLEAFAQLTWAAIANTEARERLAQSRARVIAAADEARRRLQRDVHDGAQQRLVHTIIVLKLARDRAKAGGEIGDLIAEALANAEEANQQLRDTVRGILPAALTRFGLAAGIESIVADAMVDIELDLEVPRLPVAVETTGYFAVAEAVTNAVKHAGASGVSVRAAIDDGHLVITVADDGAGGADPARGTGLTGLADRVAASDGTLEITSAAGEGTSITVRSPVPGPAVQP